VRVRASERHELGHQRGGRIHVQSMPVAVHARVRNGPGRGSWRAASGGAGRQRATHRQEDLIPAGDLGVGVELEQSAQVLEGVLLEGPAGEGVGGWVGVMRPGVSGGAGRARTPVAAADFACALRHRRAALGRPARLDGPAASAAGARPLRAGASAQVGHAGCRPRTCGWRPRGLGGPRTGPHQS
jgi:hypothetical protein